MATFLFATLDAGGNLPPAVGIARELVRLGHRVRFLGHPRQEATITASGAEFQPYSHSPRMALAEQLPTLQQISMLVSVFTDAGIAQDVVEEARRERAEMVIVDCLLLGALDAAAKAGLFTVALVHSFYAFFDGPFRRTPITAMLALAHNLPLVIAPMHPLLDQRMVGKAVQDAGAGLLIKPSASAEEIASALRTAVDSASLHLGAAAVRQRLREADGARTGALFLAEIAG